MEAQSPKGQVRFVAVADHAEADARAVAMRAAGELEPDETVVFLITGVNRFEIGRVCAGNA
jgi:hypothetical protein